MRSVYGHVRVERCQTVLVWRSVTPTMGTAIVSEEAIVLGSLCALFLVFFLAGCFVSSLRLVDEVEYGFVWDYAI